MHEQLEKGGFIAFWLWGQYMGCNACAEQLFPEMQECASVQTCCEGILLDWHSYYTNLLMENLHVLYICFFCGGKFRLSVCRSMNPLFDAALCRSAPAYHTAVSTAKPEHRFCSAQNHTSLGVKLAYGVVFTENPSKRKA